MSDSFLPRLGLSLAALAASPLACADPNSCDPGAQRPCTTALDGGAAQRGYEACGAAGLWSSCVPVGACAAGSGALPVYSRCASSGQCGPSNCAVCGSYHGVQNPTAQSVCYAFCQSDPDCATDAPSSGVAPRCVFGQCALYCQPGARCPHDSACLAWNTAALAAANPGFFGLCE